MLREAVTRADPGPLNAAARRSAEPPWAPTPGSSRIARGISSRSRARKRGSVAPTTAPAPLVPTGAGEAVGETVDRARDPLVERHPAGVGVEQVGRAGVRGPDEDEDPGAGGSGCVDERRQRVGAEQRVEGRGVGTESLDRPPGSLGAAEQGVGVGGGADRHVAALAVGDDEQARLPGRPDNRFERRPARCAERLEAGELRLDGDAGGSGRCDQLAAAGLDGGGGAITGPASATAPRPGILAGDRVEPKADLTAALDLERRKPVREWCRALGRLSP